MTRDALDRGSPADTPLPLDRDPDPSPTSLIQRLSAQPPGGPETPPPPAPAPDRPHPPLLHPQDLLDRVAEGARAAVRLSRITVQLSPPDLGTIHIAVESRQGNLSARFHATHPSVHTWLESHSPALHARLAEAGLSFQGSSFSTAANHNGAPWNGEPPPHPPFADYQPLPETLVVRHHQLGRPEPPATRLGWLA